MTVMRHSTAQLILSLLALTSSFDIDDVSFIQAYSGIAHIEELQGREVNDKVSRILAEDIVELQRLMHIEEEIEASRSVAGRVMPPALHAGAPPALPELDSWAQKTHKQ
jgi:hypothetical protein